MSNQFPKPMLLRRPDGRLEQRIVESVEAEQRAHAEGYRELEELFFQDGDR